MMLAVEVQLINSVLLGRAQRGCYRESQSKKYCPVHRLTPYMVYLYDGVMYV